MRSIRRLTRTGPVLLGMLASGFMFAATPAVAGTGHAFSASFGSPGAGQGQLHEPAGVAVSEIGAAKGDVYVADKGNNRVEVFGEKGEYLTEFNGKGTSGELSAPEAIAIDNSGSASDPSDGDMYVVNSGQDMVDKFGANGEFLSQLQGPPRITGVAVDPSGGLWVAAQENEDILEFDDAAHNALVTTMEPYPRQVDAGTSGLSVDSEENLYRGSYEVVVKLNKEGGVLESEVSNCRCTTGIAIDPATNKLFVDQRTSVAEYGPFGEPYKSPLHQFDSGHVAASSGIAIDGASDTVYVTDSTNDDVVVATPGPTPATSETLEAKEINDTSALLRGKLNEKLNYSFAYSAGASCTGGKTTPLVQEGNGEVSAQVTGLEPDKEYAFCVVSENAFGSSSGSALLFMTPAAAPEIVSEKAVSQGEAGTDEFTADINSNNEETTYTFEYSTEASGEELEGTVETTGGAPIPGGEFGGTTVGVAVSVEPINATYYYRVVAKNEQSEKEGKLVRGKVEAYTKVPIVEEESVSNLSLTGATLEALANPDWLNSTYHFEYAPGTPAGKQLLEEGTGTRVGGGNVPGGNEFGGAKVTAAVEGLQSYAPYYYRVVAESAATKNPSNADKAQPIRGEIKLFTTRSLPITTTGEAQNITRTGATLSGMVTAPFVKAAYYYEYINSAGYQAALATSAGNPYAEGEATAPLPIESSFTPQPVGPVAVGGLLADTTYHYRLVAKNEFGWEYGSDHTFTTTARVLPSVATGSASGVSQNAATITGTVGTNGLATSYGFEIATQPGEYGPATGLGSVGGAATETVTTTLGELQPGTTYYYRLTATNSDGTSYGEPATFATPGFPTLLVPQSELPQIANPSVAFPTGSQENTGTTEVKTKRLTKAQKLAKALKACRRGRRRERCEKAARARYGPVKARHRGKGKKK